MERIKAFVFNILLHKYVLGGAVTAYKKMEGYKTQVCMGLWAAVWIAAKLGYIDPALAGQVELGLGVAGGFSFTDKLARIEPYVDQAVKAVKDEASH